MLVERSVSDSRMKTMSSSTEMLDKISINDSRMRMISSSTEILDKRSINDNRMKTIASSIENSDKLWISESGIRTVSSAIKTLEKRSNNDDRTRIASLANETFRKQSINDNQMQTISSSTDASERLMTNVNQIRTVSPSANNSRTVMKTPTTDTSDKRSANDSRIKIASSSSDTLDKLSVDELYEFLLRYDLNMRSLAEKFKSERVCGADLMSFEEDDYKKISVTYGERKKLKLLIEQKQLNSNTRSVVTTTQVFDSAQIQKELNYLKAVVENQEKQIQIKNKAIQQLEDILGKKDQQIQYQDSMIEQLEVTIQKQCEENLIYTKLMHQNTAPQNCFAQQSAVVQDQLMNIPNYISKISIVLSDPSNQNVPVVQSNVLTAIDLSKNMQHVPVLKTSLPTSCEGPNSSDVHFPAVYHPDQEVLVTKPIIENPYNINNYGTYKVTIYSQDSQHIITETLLTIIPEIEICVPKQFVVRDSINNIVVGGIITLKRVEENSVIFTGTTDQTGTATLPDALADGAYEVEVYSPDNSKLQHLKFIMVIYQNRRQNFINKFIGRSDLGSNQMHMVLEWDAEPKDLDSHLFSSDGKHVYYLKRSDGNIMLDCDVQNGFGPETMTFTIEPNLKYVYAVHRYSYEPMLTQSKARVTFNFDTESTQISKFENENKLINGEIHCIPEITRPEARFWIVCMIDGSTKQIKFFPNAFEDHNDYQTNTIGMKYFTA
ncbi:unnamed protein product [Adineta steineri]|uniref:Uncharacterized protein n=2 Tax=Adineta steineri TaxID=433720 RepID=A0A813WPH6_9BILA|nr:unnamed protein product [Adineta steineri]